MPESDRDKIARDTGVRIAEYGMHRIDGRHILEIDKTTNIIAAALDEHAEGLRKRIVQLETLLAKLRESLLKRVRPLQAKDGGGKQ